MMNLDSRKYWCCGLLLVAGVMFTSLALAWSSKGFPPCEPVHQMAIQNVLSNQVEAKFIKILQIEQKIVDLDQQATNSFEHSMTGLTDGATNLQVEQPIYMKETETFIHTNLMAAIEARKAGNITLAYTNLGKAMHTLEDATSPAHSPFQGWKDHESLWEEIRHVSKEYDYPISRSDTDQIHERIELEGSVRYAYAIFMEETNLPEHFFNPTNGELELPVAYLKPRSN